MISLNKFINNTKGTKVDVPWGNGRLKGQCVSLIQQYIGQCLDQPMKARGNAKDWVNTYVNEGLGVRTSTPRTGDLIVFPHDGGGYGHIAIYIDSNTLYDQNNLRHDNGCAGYGKIFSNDLVYLRPNKDVIVNDGKYLNLNPDIDTWRVYPMGVAPVKGNECKILYPSKFGGLSYTLQGYSQANVAIISTRDYGNVQIYIGAGTEGKYSITDNPKYGLVK